MNWLKKIIGKGNRPPRLSEDFEIDLGPEWEPQHEKTHFGWADMEKGRQIIIAVMAALKRLNKDEYYHLALLHMGTKQAFFQFDKPDFKFSELITKDFGHGVEFILYGSDPTMPIQVSMTAIAGPKKVVILTYHNYNEPLPEEDFQNESDKVRSLLKVLS